MSDRIRIGTLLPRGWPKLLVLDLVAKTLFVLESSFLDPPFLANLEEAYG